MKIGKYIKLGDHNHIKIGYGTVDYKNLKTIYVKLNSWIELHSVDDFDCLLNKNKKKIKDYVNNLDNTMFKNKSIVDLHIRTKGVKKEKKAFMDLEITLFANDIFDVKTKQTKSTIKNITVNIINDILINNNIYTFHKQKK